MMGGFNAAFMWHFRRERVRMAALGLTAAAFVALVLGLSDSIRPIDVQELFESLPPALRALMGMNEV